MIGSLGESQACYLPHTIKIGEQVISDPEGLAVKGVLPVYNSYLSGPDHIGVVHYGQRARFFIGQ
jgi:hypothetical protein